MSATLFDHTDRDGDALTVYKRAAHCVAEPIAVTINAETETEQAVALTPAAVTRLRAALAPHDPADVERPWAVGDEAIVFEDRPAGAYLFAGDRVEVKRVDSPTTLVLRFKSGRGHGRQEWYVRPTALRRPTPEPAPVIEIGKEYELLPGATYRSGGVEHESSASRCGATRVRVIDGPDSDGDYEVVLLDGPGARTGGACVQPRFLVDLEPASAPTAQTIEQRAEEAIRALNPRRLAAVTAAAELVKTSGTIASASDLRELAAYLLGEQVAA